MREAFSLGLVYLCLWSLNWMLWVFLRALHSCCPEPDICIQSDGYVYSSQVVAPYPVVLWLSSWILTICMYIQLSLVKTQGCPRSFTGSTFWKSHLSFWLGFCSLCIPLFWPECGKCFETVIHRSQVICFLSLKDCSLCRLLSSIQELFQIFCPVL